MTALPHETPQPIPPDPRKPVQLRAGDITIDHRAQRDIDDEEYAKIINGFDWLRFEAPTVVRLEDDTLVAIEGQHRCKAVQALDPNMRIWCMVLLDPLTVAEQAQLGLDIARGRKAHTAYDKWMNALHAEHPHEVQAARVFTELGLRLGKSKPSTMTLACAGTIRRIVHGGAWSPEDGAELLRRTLTTVMGAWPTYDHDSSTSRWDRHILLAVAEVHRRYWDNVNRARLETSIQIKPAMQWISIGAGQDPGPPDARIFAKIIEQYNRGLKSRRLR